MWSASRQESAGPALLDRGWHSALPRQGPTGLTGLLASLASVPPPPPPPPVLPASTELSNVKHGRSHHLRHHQWLTVMSRPPGQRSGSPPSSHWPSPAPDNSLLVLAGGCTASHSSCLSIRAGDSGPTQGGCWVTQKTPGSERWGCHRRWQEVREELHHPC